MFILQMLTVQRGNKTLAVRLLVDTPGLVESVLEALHYLLFSSAVVTVDLDGQRLVISSRVHIPVIHYADIGSIVVIIASPEVLYNSSHCRNTQVVKLILRRLDVLRVEPHQLDQAFSQISYPVFFPLEILHDLEAVCLKGSTVAVEFGHVVSPFFLRPIGSIYNHLGGTRFIRDESPF